MRNWKKKRNGFLKKIPTGRTTEKSGAAAGKARERRAGCGDSEADAGKAETQSGFAKKAVR